MRWRIYLSPTEFISSTDTTPQALETKWHKGVQVIVQEDKDHNWATQSNSDYYVWDDRGDGPRWWGCDDFGLFDYLTEPGWKIVLGARSITTAEFTKTFFEAKNDPEWGKKAAFHRKERRPNEAVL